MQILNFQSSRLWSSLVLPQNKNAKDVLNTTEFIAIKLSFFVQRLVFLQNKNNFRQIKMSHLHTLSRALQHHE